MPMKLVLFLLLAACAGCADKTSSMSAVLSQSEARVLLKQCSRPSPANVRNVWDVSGSVAADIDGRIGDVSKLRSSRGQPITQPQKYLRQYGGVLVNSRKLVYVNAFYLASEFNPDKIHWRTKATIVCDGGNSAWGAMYDPSTKSFSELVVNSQLGGA
jgi:hypothetical protein